MTTKKVKFIFRDDIGFNPEATRLKKFYKDRGYVVISGDDIRDRWTEAWDAAKIAWGSLDVREEVAKQLNGAIIARKNVYLDVDFSDWKKKLWLWSGCLFKGVILSGVNTGYSPNRVYDFYMTASDEQILANTPRYFQNHNGEDFRNFKVGSERARAVALHEIRRHRDYKKP